MLLSRKDTRMLLPTLMLESVVLYSGELLRPAMLLPAETTEMNGVLSRIPRLDDPICDSDIGPVSERREYSPLVEVVTEM